MSDRFWSKVKKTEGCWIWTGAKQQGGYGRFKRGNSVVSAHRLSYEMHVGPIPAGQFCLHRCDNRACVRPDHLFLGDHAANMADMRAKGRQVRGSVNGKAKLSDANVIAIKAAAGTLEEIGSAFGVSAAHISNIKRGKKWKHVV